ncbi:MAG: YerC/YecD family TrpR-related protein [Coriobacteriia bacterium]|nr:YerC/YecD family TrpR-related protein [Coriobacteriia bacterium]
MTTDRVRTPEVERFLTALSLLEDDEERYQFLIDVCTVREIHDIAGRLDVAERLDSGEVYADIQEDTGASATTIARVAKCLNYGEGGYQMVIDRLKAAGGAAAAAAAASPTSAAAAAASPTSPTSPAAPRRSAARAQ